ncbi:chromate resistance protein ChrB domain-containing protein [Minwuia sp.]|uniref:chromate resistance protein ChrB domain-containing protein n=1 Tax=Minwuia sp. TaxID=2493630 RepID=UPI003A8D7BB2
MASPTEITIQQLSRLIGTPDAPVIIDVCIDADFALDPRIIPGAIRQPFDRIEALVPRLQGQRAVVYCQKGLKLSQGAAALLRASGVRAESLAGGQWGWRDAVQPLVPVARLPVPDAEGRTVWVTRHRPKIDRLACPWLIRRFVDRRARFLFVSPSEVGAVAGKFGATPFDADDAVWRHDGDHCTFDAMLDGFGLKTDALARLALIVRGADTSRHDLAPECAGLLAVSLGLSRMYRNDLAMLEAGFAIYDALYRWARDASDETHDETHGTVGKKQAA